MASKFTSYLSSIEKDLAKAEAAVMRKAAVHVARKMREKARSLFRKQSGNLLKGIKWDKRGPHTALVGVGPPAQHAHLLEFGTRERKQKRPGLFAIATDITTRKGVFRQPKDGKTGKIVSKPFILPTISEQADKVKEILSERWI